MKVSLWQKIAPHVVLIDKQEFIPVHHSETIQFDSTLPCQFVRRFQGCDQFTPAIDFLVCRVA